MTATFRVCLAVAHRDTLACFIPPAPPCHQWVCWERALLTHQVGFGCLNIGSWCHLRCPKVSCLIPSCCSGMVGISCRSSGKSAHLRCLQISKRAQGAETYGATSFPPLSQRDVPGADAQEMSTASRVPMLFLPSPTSIEILRVREPGL